MYNLLGKHISRFFMGRIAGKLGCRESWTPGPMKAAQSSNEKRCDPGKSRSRTTDFTLRPENGLKRPAMRREPEASGLSDCRKTPRRAREGGSPFALQSYPAACTPGTGDFSGGKSHFPEEKSVPCSLRARKSFKISAETAGGGRGGGETPPSTSLSKSLF